MSAAAPRPGQKRVVRRCDLRPTARWRGGEGGGGRQSDRDLSRRGATSVCTRVQKVGTPRKIGSPELYRLRAGLLAPAADAGIAATAPAAQPPCVDMDRQDGCPCCADRTRHVPGSPFEPSKPTRCEPFAFTQSLPGLCLLAAAAAATTRSRMDCQCRRSSECDSPSMKVGVQPGIASATPDDVTK